MAESQQRSSALQVELHKCKIVTALMEADNFAKANAVQTSLTFYRRPDAVRVGDTMIKAEP